MPAKLREIITYRYCTQVVDRTSSDMVLGKGKADQGADASILSEDHKGVGVLVWIHHHDGLRPAMSRVRGCAGRACRPAAVRNSSSQVGCSRNR